MDDPQRARHAVPAGVQELATQRAELRSPHGIEEDGRREGAGGGGRAGLVSLPTLHTPCYSTVSRIVIGTGPMEMKRRGDDGATRRWANSSGPRLIVCGRSAISTRGDGMPTRNNSARLPRCTSPSHPLLIHPFFFSRFHPPPPYLINHVVAHFRYIRSRPNKRRNSLRARPPPMKRDDPHYPGNDRRYEDLSEGQIPLTESLLDCMERGACLFSLFGGCTH